MADAFARQDLDAALSVFDPNATVIFPDDSRATPFYGKHVGSVAIRQAFTRVAIEYELIWQEIRDIVIDHERAVIYRVSHIRVRGTGRPCTLVISDWLTFREGLITELECISNVTELVDLNK